MNKRCLALCALLVLSILFSGCQKTPDYSVYDPLPGTEYLDYLMMEQSKVFEALDITAETWDYLDEVPCLSIWKKEPVMIADAPWQLQFRFMPDGVHQELDDPLYLDFYIFHREVASDDFVVKNQAVSDIYELLKSELGEPAEPFWPSENRAAYHTIAEGLENGFTTECHRDIWVLAEQVKPPKPYTFRDADANILLLAYLDVHYLPNQVWLQLNYRLMDSRRCDLADYPQDRSW